MDSIFAKTRELADALMLSEEYKAMKASEEAAMGNREASALIAEYMDHQRKLEAMQSGEPNPTAMVEHMQAMEDIQAKMQSIPEIAELTLNREKFSSLMDQVNQVLNFILTGKMDESGNGCTGSCATCKGCH